MALAALLSLVLAVGAAGALQAVRISGQYAIGADAVTAGGGPDRAASYRHTDSAIGQPSPCGFSSSGNYRNQAGIVQAWVLPEPLPPPTGPGKWVLF